MSDSEPEELNIAPPPPEEENSRTKRIQGVRTEILKWKKLLLNKLTKDNQDTLVLDVFRNEINTFYYLIRDVLDGEDPSEELQEYDIWRRISKYFPLRDGAERIDLSHILYRDLVEFPFTFNSKLVNSFLEKNSLEDAEILPNK